MATTTTNFGWSNPASGDAQAASELAITATIDAIDADLWGVAQSVAAMSGYYAPVTDPSVPELIFDADGDVIMAFVAL